MYVVTLPECQFFGRKLATKILSVPCISPLLHLLHQQQDPNPSRSLTRLLTWPKEFWESRGSSRYSRCSKVDFAFLGACYDVWTALLVARQHPEWPKDKQDHVKRRLGEPSERVIFLLTTGDGFDPRKQFKK